MQQRLENVNQQVEQSLAKCNEAKAELERMFGNHNALLGAQILAKQLVDEWKDEEVIAVPVVPIANDETIIDV